MGLMTATGLVADKTTAGSIARTVNYKEIDAAVVLEEAQTLLYSMLRCREMRTLWSASFSVGDSSKALPSDFLDPIGPFATDTANIRYKLTTEHDLMRRRSYDGTNTLNSGTPAWFAIFNEQVNFDAKFDTATTLQLLYFKLPALLSAGTLETNFLTTRYPHVVRQACRTQAHAFMKNWTAFNEELPVLQSMVDRVSVEADLSYRGADIDMDPA